MRLKTEQTTGLVTLNQGEIREAIKDFIVKKMVLDYNVDVIAPPVFSNELQSVVNPCFVQVDVSVKVDIAK